MDNSLIAPAISPLRWIFWGGLICLLDFSYSYTANGSGFKFDFINDVVGTMMICLGVFKLANFRVSDAYARAMAFAKVIACLAVLDAARDHLIVRWPPIVPTALHVFGLAKLVAIILFCLAMRWLSLEHRLLSSAGSWRMTATLYIVIYALPWGAYHLMALFAMITGKSFHFNLGPAALLLLVVFAIPLIHFFISTSRMRREAEYRSGGI